MYYISVCSLTLVLQTALQLFKHLRVCVVPMFLRIQLWDVTLGERFSVFQYLCLQGLGSPRNPVTLCLAFH
jgi:hypothetical protein